MTTMKNDTPMTEDTRLNILPSDDFDNKIQRLRDLMAAAGLDAIFVSDNANRYYLTGRVFNGFILLTANDIHYFIRRPNHLDGPGVFKIRKPEEIANCIDVSMLGTVGLELSQSSYALISRLAAALHLDGFENADPVLMAARAVKTPYELAKIEHSSQCLTSVYRQIPRMYRPGMSDIELQIEIERITRLTGGLGQFRVNGEEMEINMGSVLTGDNADTPSSYDFALGGAGADPSLPIGADGSIIRPGNTVMVDTNGDFTGYMTDMSRTFACGEVTDQRALKAHQLSIDICRRLESMGRPGVKAADMYKCAVDMTREAGLEHLFMGHRSQAGFIGHGVGIAINELPVIAPRSRDVLAAGNVIALEPKFVIPHIGAVGVENTYVVTENGLKRFTEAPEQMLRLEE